MAISYINKKALEKDVEKYLKTFAEAYADTAANEITKFAQQAIQRFYDHYTPKYYDRTDDLKKNSFSKYKHNNGNQYYGGVRISTYNMSPYVVGGLNNRRFHFILLDQLGEKAFTVVKMELMVDIRHIEMQFRH